MSWLIKTSKFKWNIFIFFWMLNFVIGVYYKFHYFTKAEHLHYTWIPDTIFFLSLIYYLIKENEFKVLSSIGLLLLFKFLGSFSLYSTYESLYYFVRDVFKTWMSYVYIFPLFIFLKPVLTAKSKNQIPKLLDLSILIWSLIIVLGVFLGYFINTYFLKTYESLERFGISGWLFPSSYVSYLYMLLLIILYSLSIQYPIKKTYKYLLFLVSLAALFSGTKTVYAFLISFYAIISLKTKVYKKAYFIGFFLIGVLSLIFFRENLLQSFSVLVNLFKEEDLLTFVLSYRNHNLIYTWDILKLDWGTWNYLLGGINNRTQLTELAFADLFFNFGALGSILFILTYYQVILRFIEWNLDKIVFFTLCVLLIAMGGNFFDKIATAYLLSILFYLHYKPK